MSHTHPVVETPWGSWQVLLHTPAYKVKKLSVNPGCRTSYQKHFKRSETWTIIEGQGDITLDTTTKTYYTGDVVQIQIEQPHRLENTHTTPVTIIEVQLGSEFVEEDIIRLSDDYGRST
jgi:mannose-6-phosphate isomerase